MLFEYFVEFGTPNKNKIILQERSLHCKYAEAVYDPGNLFYIYNMFSGIALCFALDDGYLVGVQSGLLNMDRLPQVRIEIPDYIDGKLRAKCKDSVYLSCCKYLDFNSDSVSYDKEHSILAFGNLLKVQITVHVSENLYVSLDGQGELISILIRL